MEKTIIIVLVCVVALLALPMVVKAFRGDGEEGDAGPVAQTQPPVSPSQASPYVVNQNPPKNAQAVSPGITELTVVFDVPMAGGFSWTGGGDQFPETTGKPYWSNDRKTCTLPVRLKPNWAYGLGLNSPSHRNFRSADGKELRPQRWEFRTGK
jgi:hypothetical protein